MTVQYRFWQDLIYWTHYPYNLGKNGKFRHLKLTFRLSVPRYHGIGTDPCYFHPLVPPLGILGNREL